MTPHLVVFPESVEAVAGVVGLAHRFGVAVTPWGGGTHQNVGLPPYKLDLILSMERLGSVLMYEPDDLTISVQAGARVADLASRLASGRHQLPLDVPATRPSTVGGTVATALGGPRTAQFGGCRDFLIGARVVLADGSTSKSGGMVVKNVTGYDLHKLHVGALGTLGVVVDANFKVIPIPDVDATLVIRGCRLDHAFDICSELRRSAISPSAVTILGGLPSLLRPDHQSGTRTTSDDWRHTGVHQPVEDGIVDILVRCEGRREPVARHLRDISAMCGRMRILEPEEVDSDVATTMWNNLAEFGHGYGDISEPRAVYRLNCLPSSAAALLQEVARAAEAERLAWSFVGHVNEASLTLELRPCDEGSNWLMSLDTLSRRLAFWWPAALCVDNRRLSGPKLARVGGGLQVSSLERRLKKTFDPTGIMNPGRHTADL